MYVMIIMSGTQNLTGTISRRDQPPEAGQQQDQLQTQRVTGHHRLTLLHPQPVDGMGKFTSLFPRSLRFLLKNICEK